MPNTGKQINDELRAEGLGDYLAQKLRDGETRMDKLDRNVDELNHKVASLSSDVKSILDIMATAEAGLKFIGLFGKFIKWLAAVAAAITALALTWEKFWK